MAVTSVYATLGAHSQRSVVCAGVQLPAGEVLLPGLPIQALERAPAHL